MLSGSALPWLPVDCTKEIWPRLGFEKSVLPAGYGTRHWKKVFSCFSPPISCPGIERWACPDPGGTAKQPECSSWDTTGPRGALPYALLQRVKAIPNGHLENNLLPGRRDFSFPRNRQICLGSAHASRRCRSCSGSRLLRAESSQALLTLAPLQRPCPASTLPLLELAKTLCKRSRAPSPRTQALHFPPHTRHGLCISRPSRMRSMTQPGASRCWVLLIPLPLSFLSAPCISLRLHQACLTAAARCGDPIHLLEKKKERRRKKWHVVTAVCT